MTTETKLKATPGPWVVMPKKYGVDIMRLVSSNRFGIAMVYGGAPDGVGVREGLANARLIAEAGTVASETGLSPRQLAEQRQELLEAASKALDIIQWMSGSTDFSPEGPAATAWQSTRDGDLPKIRAAIAKARGETELAV